MKNAVARPTINGLRSTVGLSRISAPIKPRRPATAMVIMQAV
jgi:hypothetical protein